MRVRFNVLCILASELIPRRVFGFMTMVQDLKYIEIYKYYCLLTNKF